MAVSWKNYMEYLSKACGEIKGFVFNTEERSVTIMV